MLISRRRHPSTVINLVVSYSVEETMSDMTIEKAAAGLVGLWALSLAGRALLHVYKTFLRPGKNLKKLGKWAVVTGATGELPLPQSGHTGFYANALPFSL
jgi:hypothetical protein